MALRFINNTALPGIILVETEVFSDARGFFTELYHQQKYTAGGISKTFVQDNRSHSIRNVVRGLHYQLSHPQAKLVCVIAGEIYDVAVDIRRGSPTFGKWDGLILSEKNGRQLFVPEGFAHGFCVLSETADVLYKCTDFYRPDDELGIAWNDPDIGIDWPITNPLMSTKDGTYPRLRAVPDRLLPRYGG